MTATATKEAKPGAQSPKAAQKAAAAAGTDVSRVTIHAVHQHTAPVREREQGPVLPRHQRRSLTSGISLGMISSTILTLIVIPAIYVLVKEMGLRKRLERSDAE